MVFLTVYCNFLINDFFHFKKKDLVSIGPFKKFFVVQNVNFLFKNEK